MDKAVGDILIIGYRTGSQAFIGVREEEVWISGDGHEDACLEEEEVGGCFFVNE